ncbi:uncharacterized protein LOC129757867 isoform X3 [Uranotaenia lowii]|uniref:uncharacterized protein LOC129757867 isoform X3 n=1 Tax=Uranotaenia lowii TaxID=190385 RepID=UPI0024788FCD|nr:uncharacterized protein LOC129757867 isoform X3 [Uranotaenia lowii]
MHIRWLLFVATVVVVCCFTSASGPGEELAVGQPDFSNNSTQTLHGRRKRYIIFREISRGFARANVKDRMIDITNIWAHAYGFRWNVEYNNPPGLMITKRDLHESIGELIQAHGFDGRACILRTFCEMSKVMTPKSGFMLKLFRKIFTLPEGDEMYFPYLKSSDCQELDDHCPISQLEIPSELEPAPEDSSTSSSASDR